MYMVSVSKGVCRQAGRQAANGSTAVLCAAEVLVCRNERVAMFEDGYGYGYGYSDRNGGRVRGSGSLWTGGVEQQMGSIMLAEEYDGSHHAGMSAGRWIDSVSTGC